MFDSFDRTSPSEARHWHIVRPLRFLPETTRMTAGRPKMLPKTAGTESRSTRRPVRKPTTITTIRTAPTTIPTRLALLPTSVRVGKCRSPRRPAHRTHRSGKPLAHHVRPRGTSSPPGMVEPLQFLSTCIACALCSFDRRSPRRDRSNDRPACQPALVRGIRQTIHRARDTT